MVDLHHQALLADIAITSSVRTQLNSYCSMFSAFGSLSVFLSYAVWNKGNLFGFRIFCVSSAMLVTAGFVICCSALQDEFERRKAKEEAIEGIVLSER